MDKELPAILLVKEDVKQARQRVFMHGHSRYHALPLWDRVRGQGCKDVPDVAVFFYCIDDIGYCFVSIFRTQPHCEGTFTHFHLLVGMSRGFIGSDLIA
jgi:hypothetical protein